MPAQSGHEQVIVISRGPGNRPSASRQTRSITCLDSLPCSSSTNEPTEPAQSTQIASQRAGAATEISIFTLDLRAADQRLDLAARELEVDHRAVTNVGAPARQAVREIGIAFEVVAPSLAPEAPGDLAALDDDRRDDAPFLLQLLDFLLRLLATRGGRNIGPESPEAHDVPPSWVAAARSSFTSAISSASASSVRLISPPPASKSSAILRFDSMSSSIRSSIVPRQTNLCTRTLRFCPMRKARSVAWFSTAGFHQRSKCTTCEAAVRVRPEPPAFSDNTKNGTLSSSWNVLTSVLRLPTAVSPLSARPGLPKTPVSSSTSGSTISLNWVKTSTFSWRQVTVAAISASRPNLPLSSLAQATPPPRPCCAWLQICLRRIRVASTSPRRPISSLDSFSRS